MNGIKEEIPIIYLFIYRVIREKSNGGRIITYKTIRDILSRRLHKIPWRLHYYVIKEMIGFGLLKEFSRGNFELTGNTIDKRLNKFNCIIS